MLVRYYALLSYSTAEFEASFPDGFRAREHFLFLNDTSCGLWLNGRMSCFLDRPSDLPNWSPCYNLSISECLEVQHENGGCGYCLGPDGGCLPGTRSGKALFHQRGESPSCAAPDSKEPFREEPDGANAEGVWLFTGGKPAQAPLFQSCFEGQARYVSRDGMLVMGNASYGVSYGEDLRCSWEIWPSGQEAEGTLLLKINVTSLRYDGDYLELIRLDFNGSAVSGSSMLARGSAFLSSEVDGPVRVEFRSFRDDRSRARLLDLGIWSVEWSYKAPVPVVTTTPFQYAAERGPINPPNRWQTAQQIAIVAMFFSMSLPFIYGSCWLWKRWRRGPSQPPSAQVPAGLDLKGLEDLHPSCKPQVLGASVASQLACSVCLSNFQPGDVCRKLPCDHYFHQECIDAWLKKARNCPTCRGDLLGMQEIKMSGHDPEAALPEDGTVQSTAAVEEAEVPVQRTPQRTGDDHGTEQISDGPERMMAI